MKLWPPSESNTPRSTPFCDCLKFIKKFSTAKIPNQHGVRIMTLWKLWKLWFHGVDKVWLKAFRCIFEGRRRDEREIEVCKVLETG